MNGPGSRDVFVFDRFHFDRRAACLFRCTDDGRSISIQLGARALTVLGVLIERSGELVSKDELLAAVWPDTIVEEANLTVQISALRRVLDQGRSGESCIRTVVGRGYRLVARVTHAKEAQFDWAASPPIAPARPEERLPQPEPPGSRTPLAPVRGSLAGAMVAGGLLLVAILASGGWWMRHDNSSPRTVSAVAPAAPRPVAFSPQDRRMSVIVLPFENSSGDPRQDDLAAGITRDVTDRIARNPNSLGLVIPAATAASYRGKTVNLQTIGRDHNVHFALTGSARRQDGRLIVSATVYETDSDKVLWSQQFDRPDNSDEWKGIIAQINYHYTRAAIDAEVARAMREHPDNLDKRDLMLAYRSSPLGPDTKETIPKSIALIERALAIDPDYVDALVEKANMYATLVDQGYSSDPSADLSTARKAVDRAFQLAPDDLVALRRKARILGDQGDLEGAAALVRKSLEREPLDGYRVRQLGTIQMRQGHFKEALESFTTAKRLGGDPPSPGFSQSLALGLLANDRFPEAIAEAQQARAGWETVSDVGRTAEGAWLALIAAESENGQDAEARADLQKFLATPRTYRTLAEVQKNPFLATNPKLLDGLQRAGMPAE